MSLPEATVTKILRLYSDNGNVQAADFLLESFLNGVHVFKYLNLLFFFG